ncbi:MAG: DDE-type integrase/transposase/recombinase [Chitinivibrionales bacterium]|nr:DDE-type integrase/transposase/recombinase [Chitinivibrionales bacterium]MBD3358320.1 DDE-type integrase/transposase/recombinase [Chitinivibrionales bacterium]
MQTAQDNPWYGYRKIGIMCRWSDAAVTDRLAYRVMAAEGMLHKKRSRKVELHQAGKLYELLPAAPNELWQMDITYVYIPGYGWWYVVTVIDYYSRYLLAARLVSSYCAHEVTQSLADAREEAEKIHDPLDHQSFVVTDNGSSFIAKRFLRFVRDEYRHVRIQYRTPTQLGLLERFHETLKEEEVYWRLYDDPNHARICIAEFRQRYNYHRPHWSLVLITGGDPVTPAQVYRDALEIRIPKWQAWARGARAKLDKLLEEAA